MKDPRAPERAVGCALLRARACRMLCLCCVCAVSVLCLCCVCVCAVCCACVCAVSAARAVLYLLIMPIGCRLVPACCVRCSRLQARECETLMAIRHAHLLIFYGAGVSAVTAKPFMVTEFMALGSLKAVLADLARALAFLTWA